MAPRRLSFTNRCQADQSPEGRRLSYTNLRRIEMALCRQIVERKATLCRLALLRVRTATCQRALIRSLQQASHQPLEKDDAPKTVKHMQRHDGTSPIHNRENYKYPDNGTKKTSLSCHCKNARSVDNFYGILVGYCAHSSKSVLEMSIARESSDDNRDM